MIIAKNKGDNVPSTNLLPQVLSPIYSRLYNLLNKMAKFMYIVVF